MAGRMKSCYQKLGIRYLIMEISRPNYVTNSQKQKQKHRKVAFLKESPSLCKKFQEMKISEAK